MAKNQKPASDAWLNAKIRRQFLDHLSATAQVEQQESYRVALYANDMSVREWVIGENSLRVSFQEIVEANVPQNASLWFSVRQIGRFAQSDPLIFSAD